MKDGYESLLWIADADGSTYACFADDLSSDLLENRLFFNVEEYSRCFNIDRLVGQKAG